MLPPRNASDTGNSLSAILTRIAADESKPRISIADLLSLLQERAIGALIFVFAFPNVFPMPPGASSILGAPLLFLTAQLALGREPWLPKFITERSMERAHFAAIVHRVSPWLERAERLLRRRYQWLAVPPCEYAIGVICWLLAVVLFLPIPMGNIPPAITICLFALALLERDGVWVIVGCGAAVASVAIVWGVLFAIIESALFLLTKWFGSP